MDRLLRRAEVEELTGLRKTAIYQKMKSGEFPRPKRIGPRAVRWRASMIQEWIEFEPPTSNFVRRQ